MELASDLFLKIVLGNVVALVPFSSNWHFDIHFCRFINYAIYVFSITYFLGMVHCYCCEYHCGNGTILRRAESVQNSIHHHKILCIVE